MIREHRLHIFLLILSDVDAHSLKHVTLSLLVLAFYRDILPEHLFDQDVDWEQVDLETVIRYCDLRVLVSRKLRV